MDFNTRLPAGSGAFEFPTAGPMRPGFTFVCLLLVLGMHATGAVGQADDDPPGEFDRSSIRKYDTIALRSGDVLRGELIAEEEQDGRKMIVFRTVEGDALRLDAARMVADVDQLEDDARRYNQALATMEDTAEAHHAMVEWCIEQRAGRARFKPQIEFHRHRVMMLDPNDEAVRKKLGYRFIESEGRWVNGEQYWRSRGYVRRGTGWIPALQEALSENAEHQNEAVGQRKSELQRWERMIKRNPGQAMAELGQITDVAMLPVMFEKAKDERNPAVRSMYMEAFGAFPHPTSVNALIYFWIEDGQERALDLLKQDGFDREQATANLAIFLASQDRGKLQRAAFAIGELGSENRILSLVDALESVHTIKGGDPNRINTGFGGATPGNFQFGQPNKTRKVLVKNPEVVEALNKITEQDFGYDQVAWQRWYLDQYTNRDLPARRQVRIP